MGLGRFAAWLLNAEIGYQYKTISFECYGVHL